MISRQVNKINDIYDAYQMTIIYDDIVVEFIENKQYIEV